MHVVFVHRSGPGQFVHLMRRMVRNGDDVTLVAEDIGDVDPDIRVVRYAGHESRKRPSGCHPFVAATDRSVRTGEKVAAVLDRLRRQGRAPDLVVGHIGWGGLLFAKDVLPTVPCLGYCEFFHRSRNSDLDFDPSTKVAPADLMRVRMKNAAQLLTLDAIDAGISPTRWQRMQYPRAMRARIAVGHDGIDVRRTRPDPRASLVLPNGRTVRAGDPVVTFVARDLEPYRGFPQFMKAAALVARRHRDALFVVVGGDGVSYGTPRPDGRSWRDAALAESGLDPSRVVFLGWVPHPVLVKVFQVSAAHVYLTYPFVLSWSCLEAMAAGCAIVGSATPPVQEVIVHGRNGLLCDFFDHEALADTIRETLIHPTGRRELRAAGREHIVRNFAVDPCVDRQMRLIDAILNRSAGRSSATGPRPAASPSLISA
jgi:glycosyltransferase involved in cell wall biosynthesis